MNDQEQPEPQPPPEPQKVFGLVKEWVNRFEKIVRRKSYTLAPMLFHPALVWFGIESNICGCLEQSVEEEFKQFWAGTLGFTIDWKSAKVVPEGGTIMVVAPWYAASKIVGAPQKRGRITLILGIFPAGKLLCLHGHMSINPVTRITT